MTTVEITSKEDFEREVLNEKEKLVLVDFWRPGCHHCIQMMPIVKKLDEEIDQLKLCTINTDENQDLAMSYNIMAVPDFKFYKEGKIVGEFRGAIPEPTLREKINSLL